MTEKKTARPGAEPQAGRLVGVYTIFSSHEIARMGGMRRLRRHCCFVLEQSVGHVIRRNPVAYYLTILDSGCLAIIVEIVYYTGN